MLVEPKRGRSSFGVTSNENELRPLFLPSDSILEQGDVYAFLFQQLGVSYKALP